MSVSVFRPNPKESQTAVERAQAALCQILGEDMTSRFDEIRVVRAGVSPKLLMALNDYRVKSTDFDWIIKPRTLHHRIQKKETLTQEESERWLRAAKVVELAKAVFGNDEKAKAWLNKPRKSFGNESASSLIQSESGAQIVEEKLKQLDAGYFA